MIAVDYTLLPVEDTSCVPFVKRESKQHLYLPWFQATYQASLRFCPGKDQTLLKETSSNSRKVLATGTNGIVV